MQKWEPNARTPLARLLECIGQIGDIEAETMALLRENDIEDAPFSDAVLD